MWSMFENFQVPDEDIFEKMPLAFYGFPLNSMYHTINNPLTPNAHAQKSIAWLREKLNKNFVKC